MDHKEVIKTATINKAALLNISS